MKSIYWLQAGNGEMIVGDEGILIADRFGPFGAYLMLLGLCFVLIGPILFDPLIYTPFFRGSVILEIAVLLTILLALAGVVAVIRRLQHRRYRNMSGDKMRTKFAKGEQKHGSRLTPSQFVGWSAVYKARLGKTACVIFFNSDRRKFWAGGLFGKECSPDGLDQKSQSEMFENFTNLLKEKVGDKLEIKNL